MSLLAAGLAAAAAAAPAQQPPISGTLTAPGYTVMALAADGHVTTAVASDGRFRLRPPAARVTLQLRAPDGTYAGPIVVGRAGSHVIVGVKAGAVLGKIAYSAQLGYGTARRVPARWIDPTRWARARGGVEPFGARNLGRALSSLPNHPPPGDRDADGVPDVIDVDDDGDLVLDAVDPQVQPTPLRAVQQLSEAADAANVHAGTSRAAIDAALAGDGTLSIASDVPGPLDCGALAWCSAAADGTAPLHPHATSDQLRAGDVLIMGAPGDQVLGGVGSVFATVPAIASYGDDLGQHVVRYPLEPGAALPITGTQVRLELWRPQRRAMPADEVAEDEGAWVDIGGLAMSARPAGGAPCPADAYSAPDASLLPFGQALLDLAADTPTSESGTVGYTLDVERCLSADGQTFGPGEQATLVFASGGAEASYAFVRAG